MQNRMEVRSGSKFDAVGANGANAPNFHQTRSFTAELTLQKVRTAGRKTYPPDATEKTAMQRRGASLDATAQATACSIRRFPFDRPTRSDHRLALTGARPSWQGRSRQARRRRAWPTAVRRKEPASR